MKHTPEPWRIGGTDGSIYAAFVPVAHLSLLDKTDAERSENTRRIVACVNACAGIPTADLQNAGAGFWGRFAARNGKQRDELYQALKHLTMMARTSGGTAGPDAGLIAACEDAETALQKNQPPAESFFIGTETGIEDLPEDFQPVEIEAKYTPTHINSEWNEKLKEAEAKARRLKTAREEAEHYPPDHYATGTGVDSMSGIITPVKNEPDPDDHKEREAEEIYAAQPTPYDP